MAKAKEITGLDCAANALEWAAEVLRVRFEEVVSLRGEALNSEDIEGIHAMRVATRRLRSALRDFAPLMKRRPLKKVKKDLKRIADALGAARDQDVAIVALEKLQKEVEIAPVKAGVGKLIEERRSVRERAQLELIKTLAVSAIENLEKRFAAAIDEGINRKKSARVVSFNEAGRNAVAASLQDFCDLSASLYEPFNIEDLHELRIAAKRLRYAIELFTACWGKAIAPFAVEIAEMQSFLGEVHDTDVWIESLGERLRGSDGKPAESEYQTAVRLLSEFVKERTKNYRAALKLWSAWKENDFISRLRAVISGTSA
ncbi:MAG: CHAD domain-containing protein [Pyrinomonadaceae bacterium]|nr:CHAD domain-containing protein [Pyrinomonadaceae bacterium]